MAVWRIGLATLAMLAAALVLVGCASPPKPAAPPAGPAVSYDGTYQGTLTLTGVGAGVPREGCAANPQVTLRVVDNAFTLVQAHPNADVTAPGMQPVSATTTYTEKVHPDGTFSGESNVTGTFSGMIAGTHLTGTIEGIVCVYSVSADRV